MPRWRATTGPGTRAWSLGSALLRLAASGTSDVILTIRFWNILITSGRFWCALLVRDELGEVVVGQVAEPGAQRRDRQLVVVRKRQRAGCVSGPLADASPGLGSRPRGSARLGLGSATSRGFRGGLRLGWLAVALRCRRCCRLPAGASSVPSVGRRGPPLRACARTLSMTDISEPMPANIARSIDAGRFLHLRDAHITLLEGIRWAPVCLRNVPARCVLIKVVPTVFLLGAEIRDQTGTDVMRHLAVHGRASAPRAGGLA